MNKPVGVPEKAFWSESENEWCLAERDAEGKFHGLVKWWRPDGTLVCATEHRHGTPEGSFQRFHENGEVSRDGQFVGGKLHGIVTYRRTNSDSTEKFPAGLGEVIRRAEMDYEQGKVVGARCYGVDDRQCMEDGEPFPDRPQGVPHNAHFRKREQDGEYRWVQGHVIDNGNGTIDRTGTWRFWTPDGILVSEEPYEVGKLSGAVKTYNEEGALIEDTEWLNGEKHGSSQTFGPDGTLLTEQRYVAGEPDGPRSRLLEEDERDVDTVVVRERGEFDDKEPSGVVEYLDQSGRVVVSVDTGVVSALESIQAVLETTEDLAQMAGRFRESKEIGAAIFALARAVGRNELPTSELVTAFDALKRPVSLDASANATQMTMMLISNIARFGGGPDKCIKAALEGIRQGGNGIDLLRYGAGMLDDCHETAIALELVNAAIAVAEVSHPEMVGHCEYTRALIRASLGDPEGARRSVQAMDEDDRGGLSSYLAALFPTWSFWPGEDTRRKGLSDLFEHFTFTTPKTLVDIEVVRTNIQKSASRLVHYREQLIELFGDQKWIVPDVSHLIPDGPVEVSIPDRYQGVGIQHLVRQEWTRLTWLCFFSGLDALGLPTKLLPRKEHLPLQLVIMTRYLLSYGEDPIEYLSKALTDREWLQQERKDELFAKAKNIALSSEWFGLSMANLNDEMDLQFLQADENAALLTTKSLQDATADLFDERGDDNDDDE